MSEHTSDGLVAAGLPLEVCKSSIVQKRVSTGAYLHPGLTLPGMDLGAVPLAIEGPFRCMFVVKLRGITYVVVHDSLNYESAHTWVSATGALAQF
jgi:hypothetical protein